MATFGAGNEQLVERKTIAGSASNGQIIYTVPAGYYIKLKKVAMWYGTNTSTQASFMQFVTPREGGNIATTSFIGSMQDYLLSVNSTQLGGNADTGLPSSSMVGYFGDSDGNLVLEAGDYIRLIQSQVNNYKLIFEVYKMP